MTLTKEFLVQEANNLMRGDEVKDLDINELYMAITVLQYVTDLCLNEIEARGELTFAPDGEVIVPYMSEHFVETILTRGFLV